MTDFTNAFKLGGSAIALIASLMVATPAMAQATVEDDTGADIVVTGSSIRGVAPIGSNLVSVGQDVVEKTAAINASQLVNSVPAITTSGSVSQGENVYSYYSPQIHSLAGSASNTTLVITDGLRMPGGGTQYSQTDPNIIPTPAIERVEVLADGASSVYGSDAVAGVVNYITRKTFDGLDANARVGFAKNFYQYDLSFIWGTKWDTGGVYLAAQYNYQDSVANKDRDFASLGNYEPLGGSNNNSFACSPATMRMGSSVWLSLDSTSPVPNSADNAPCNNSIYGTLIPSQYRANVMMKVTNDFSDRLTVTAMVNYNYQQTRNHLAPGTLNSARVYGNGTSFDGATPGQSNPFYLNPVGAPGATNQFVNWLALTPDGEYGRSESVAEVFYTTAVAEYKISDSWTATLSNAFGKNRSALNTIDGFCTSCALLALNGTTQTSGNPEASSIAGQNVIALNMPLTAANSLDVWNAVGAGNRTSDTVWRSIYGADGQNVNYNTFNQTKLDLQGSLFALPAGDVRMAVGAEYLIADLEQKINGQAGIGPTTTGSTFRFYQYHRTVRSAYAEVVVPVVSPEMGIPGVYKIDFNVSGRWDDYSDVGSTTNPKFAANWEIVPGIKLRGNYATAFVAPPLAVIGDPSQGYLYASGSVGNAGALNVPVATYPNVVEVPGAVEVNSSNACTAASTVCTIGQGNLAMRRQLGGGFVNIKPQTGNSWSIGLDLAPDFMPGFRGAVTLWNNKFKGGVNSPNPNSIVNSAGLNDRLTICPQGCTQAQIEEFANLAGGATINGAIPANVYYMIDQTSDNVLNLKVQGIDAQFDYRFDAGSAGTFTIGTALTYFTKFKQNFGGGTEFDVLNTSGYNTTFPSIQFKNRANLGWQLGGFGADLFWNHTGGYRNWSNDSVAPIETDAVGNPIGGGDKVKANDTFDLNMRYNFEGGVVDGWQVYLDVQNLFDKDPPFYNGNTSGILGGAWGYNGFVSNPLGRIVSLGLRAKF